MELEYDKVQNIKLHKAAQPRRYKIFAKSDFYEAWPQNYFLNL